MKTLYLFLVFAVLNLYQVAAQVSGCTDPLSRNYNPNATINDGSCVYSSGSVSLVNTVDLSATINETSGLILWDNRIYTHNDNTDINLYGLDTNGTIAQTLPVAGTSNQDWEDIDQDSNYIYIAETGNNVNGNRTNLRIIRVDKAGLLAGNPTVNSINFSYSNQTSFTATGNNNTDFDCEAIIVGTDNIYLFTKQWVSRQTSVYSLPKTPGTYTAQLLTTYNVSGLVTGATYLEDKNLIVLCGYSTTLQPFLYLLYDFNEDNFFGANKRKLSLPLAFHQVEGISTDNGLDYYISNEHFQQSIINVPQRLHSLDLSAYLEGYLQTLSNANIQTLTDAGIIIFPNPAFSNITIQCPADFVGRQYSIIDLSGRVVLAGTLNGTENVIDIVSLSASVYTIIISGFENDAFKLVKK
ncbi:T9SS type A sorting domain-containing protein [Flavobacterium sp. Sd200]|uniref:T9SS type A sorting domain-containing protein n=1 Tax=Flavobacterium sp. Sd200 TaxID=2692211 RepID=UPI0013698A3C|nr:T9SS type A sorting domain-containing protein [Flavobacterium sp. Sd200]MXN90686.1 T9SS type A sorting domain-containing protein [Flavobacterium sp. Sd200]